MSKFQACVGPESFGDSETELAFAAFWISTMDLVMESNARKVGLQGLSPLIQATRSFL